MQIDSIKKFLIKIIRLLKWLSIKFILKFKKFKTSDSIIIFSEARGGSTWLMELLSKIPGTCINWEPLHVEKGVVPASFMFGKRPYLREEEKNDKYYYLFEKIFSLRLTTIWTTKYLTISSLIKAKYVITKFVRANLLAPYILKNFTFKYPPIVLLRHPVDTCRSQINAFENGDYSEKHVKVPECINNERYVEHISYINSLSTKLERKIALWCINNCPLIDQLNKLDVHVIFYSDLVLNPKKEIDRLLKRYRMGFELNDLKNLNLRKASQTDFDGELKKNPEEQLFKNFNKLDQLTKEKIQTVFDHFNLTLYSAHSPYPLQETLS